MITLRAGEFPQADGHHLEQPALDLAGEIGVPLDPAHQHHPVGIVRHLIHEGFDAVGRLAERHHFQLADQRAAHAGFGDSVAGQHLGLAGRIGRAVTSHRREEERLHALFLPILNHVVHDGGNVVDAAATHPDGDARTGLQAPGETAGGELCAHGGGDINDLAIWKLLANYKQAGKLHDASILTQAPRPYSPAFFHNSSTRRFTSAFIAITPGHGRVKPSPGHLRVASIPIFDP